MFQVRLRIHLLMKQMKYPSQIRYPRTICDILEGGKDANLKQEQKYGIKF